MNVEAMCDLGGRVEEGVNSRVAHPSIWMLCLDGRRPELPEVVHVVLALVDPAKGQLDRHREGRGAGSAIGELGVEARPALEIGRPHGGRRVGAGDEVVLREREDPPTTAEFVLREPGRRALPAEGPPRVADGPAVAALLAVEAEVLALLAHRRRHARERSDHLSLHVAPEAQQLAVRRERSAGRELLADWPTRTI